MTINAFNQQEGEAAAAQLRQCCGSEKWVETVIKNFPFTSPEALVDAATSAWYGQCTEEDWLEAFRHHPQIGDVNSLIEKFRDTAHLAGAEQAGVAAAAETTIERLAKGNAQYLEKMGFIFIVCATGKSADTMLQLLEGRLINAYHEELLIAMGEQHKITLIRLQKLLKDEDWSWLQRSQLTTHVLDTSVGQPGRNMTVRLQEQHNGSTWQTIAQGLTDTDGRVADLLPPQRTLACGTYQLLFDTDAYFATKATEGFYPQVTIQFRIATTQHYHVPLLINPFGYTTYRGS